MHGTERVKLKDQSKVSKKVFGINPANICCFPRRLPSMSWRRVENAFSVTISRIPRRFWDISLRCLQDIFKTSSIILRDVFKKNWKTKNYQAENIFKMFWRPKRCLLGSNLYQYLTNPNLYLTSFRWIQDKSKMHQLEPNYFHIYRFLKYQ